MTIYHYRLSSRYELGTDSIGQSISLERDPTQKIAFVGISGSGKSYAAMKLAEEMLESGDVICVIDTVGIWWGLRLGKNFDPAGGLDILILGGRKADFELPAPESAADYVVTNRVSCIMDVSTLPLPAMHEWCSLFFQKVMQLGATNSGTIHFPIEETPMLAPQSGMGSKFGQDCRNAVAHVSRVGRNFGYGVGVITQRAAAVDKNVLTQCGTLLIMRIAAELDRKAISGYVAEHSMNVDVDTQLRELSFARTGTGYLWAPTWPGRHDPYTKILVGGRKTYHPSPADLRKFSRVQLKPIGMADERELFSWKRFFGFGT